jgi:AraC-like DNA-binding protein
MTDRPSSLSRRPKSHSGAAPERDPLSDVLASIRLSGAVFFVQKLFSRWDAIQIPDGSALAPGLSPGTQSVISYHVVTEGTCFAGLPGAPPVRLEAGDVLVLPRGDRYFMSEDADFPTAPIDLAGTIGFLRGVAAGQIPFSIARGGGGSRLEVVCGFLGCDLQPFNPLVAALPRLLVVKRVRDAPPDRLERLIAATLAESEKQTPGADVVRVRLSELLFVEVIRRYLATMAPEGSGWLAGLRDDVVGRALALLHEHPARRWTLAALAKAAGASRSSFADHFARLVGDPPMQYLARWRMQLAARRLAEGDAKVSAVALEVGYDSEAAFSRAFKRLVGTAPTAWRERRVPRTRWPRRISG